MFEVCCSAVNACTYTVKLKPSSLASLPLCLQRKRCSLLKVLRAEHIFTQCASVIKVKNQFYPKRFLLPVVSYRLIATVRTMTSTFPKHLLSVAAS